MEEEKVKVKNSIKVEGFFLIKQGDRVVKTKNHLLDLFMEKLVDWLINDLAWGSRYCGGPSRDWTIGIGSDTTYTTSPTLLSLYELISDAPTIKTIVGKVNPAMGVWQAQWRVTWDAGTVSGTIGEVGIWFMRLVAWDGTAREMRARSSVADGDFSPFTIDPALPLTVEYWLQFAFA